MACPCCDRGFDNESEIVSRKGLFADLELIIPLEMSDRFGV